MSDHKNRFVVKPKDISPEAIAAGLAKGFKKAFGRSFITTVSEVDGRIHVHAEERDTGQSVMSPEDVAAFLQTTRDHVMDLTRADDNPLPHFEVGRVVRFKRDEVVAWMDAGIARAAVPKVLPPHKGKVKGRKR